MHMLSSKIVLELILLSLIIIFIIETSGFGNSVKYGIWKWFLFPKYPISSIPDRPFFCTLCMTWWVGLIYLLIINQLTLPHIVILAVISYLTDVMDSLLRLLKDLLVKVIDLLYHWLKL